MIGYVTLGTNDFDRAAKFYDELLGTIGAGRFMEMDTFIAWATEPAAPSIAIIKPFNQEAATVGNGVMIAILMPSAAAVDTFYAEAIELGAADEGAPGQRGEGFYAGYFRDLDGNKLNAFYMG